MKTILATALLLGTIADNNDKSNQVQAVKIQAKSEEVLEQAAEAMAGLGQSAALASSVDEGLALRAEAIVEADALADLEVEERLRQDEKDDSATANTDSTKNNSPPQALPEGAQANKTEQATQPSKKDEGAKKDETGDEMVEVDSSEQKKKPKKKKKNHSKHGKKHHKTDKKDKKEEDKKDEKEKDSKSQATSNANDRQSQSPPAENERVQTHVRAGDADLMAAAIQQVTSQNTPEAQEQMAQALAQSMTEDQQKELQAQLAAMDGSPPASPVPAQLKPDAKAPVAAKAQDLVGAIADPSQALPAGNSADALSKTLSLIEAGKGEGATAEQAAALAASLTPEQIEQLQNQLNQQSQETVPVEAAPQAAASIQKQTTAPSLEKKQAPAVKPVVQIAPVKTITTQTVSAPQPRVKPVNVAPNPNVAQKPAIVNVQSKKTVQVIKKSAQVDPPTQKIKSLPVPVIVQATPAPQSNIESVATISPSVLPTKTNTNASEILQTKEPKAKDITQQTFQRIEQEQQPIPGQQQTPIQEKHRPQQLVPSAPAIIAVPTQPSETDQKAQTLAKYEGDFIDLEDPNEDAEDDSASKLSETKHKHKSEIKLEVIDLNSSQHDQEIVKTRNSATKISRNLADAKVSVKRREGRIIELKSLVATQHGLAKSELKKVLKKSQSLVDNLKTYVSEGQVLLDERNKVISEEEKIIREKVEAEKKKKAEEEAAAAAKKAAAKAKELQEAKARQDSIEKAKKAQEEEQKKKAAEQQGKLATAQSLSEVKSESKEEEGSTARKESKKSKGKKSKAKAKVSNEDGNESDEQEGEGSSGRESNEESAEDGAEQVKTAAKKSKSKKDKQAAKGGKTKEGKSHRSKNEDSIPKSQDQTLTAQSLAETAQSVQAIVDANNKEWEKKYEKAVSDYASQMSETEKKYKSDLQEHNLVYEQETTKMHEKHRKELDLANKKYNDLKKTHDKEVKDLFQNVGTLKFVKEMRFFKKQWDEQKTVKKRKKIAAAMANATKAWVGDGEKVE